MPHFFSLLNNFNRTRTKRMTRRSRDELENGARNSPSREKGEIKENSDREKRERVFEIFMTRSA